MNQQALRIVFHENVPEEVLEMSCSWFLDVFGRLSGLKSNFRKRIVAEYYTSAPYTLENFSRKIVVIHHFPLHSAVAKIPLVL